jgi:hypothetical protein
MERLKISGKEGVSPVRGYLKYQCADTDAPKPPASKTSNVDRLER